jgi:uncharacterized protein (DUF58 family)
VSSRSLAVKTSDLLARVRRAVALASRMSSAEVAGAYRSTFKGQGLDFAELGEYNPGDDVRHIDWNATARLGKPFVRRYHEEREGTVMLVVDRGPGMHFGSGDLRKVDSAAEAAALLAVLAVRNRDRVGLVTYGEAQPLGLAPAKGMDPALRIVREVLVQTPPSALGESLRAGLERSARLLRRKAMVVVIGDFLSCEGLDALPLLAARHEVLCLAVRDPLERALPNAGMLRISGVGLVDSSDAGLRRRYAEHRLNAEADVRRAVSRCGAGLIELVAGEDPLPAVMAWLRRRSGGRRVA